MKIYIAAEGFQLKRLYVLKELHVLGENEEYKHFFFKAPLTLEPDEVDRKTIRYTTRNLSQLSWSEGDVPYEAIRPILQKFENHTLYTYGYTTTNFLKTILPTTVIIDTRDYQLQMPKEIPKQRCFYNHCPRYCAMAKAHVIKQHVEEHGL